MEKLNVFTTFRQRLLFWFFVLISFNLALVLLTNRYLSQRESILQGSNLVESTYTLLLKDAKAQLEFFSREPTNSTFFSTGESVYLNQHAYLFSSLQQHLITLSGSPLVYTIENDFYTSLQSKMQVTDSLFNELTRLIRQRGYKDFGLEGSMRKSAHRLEKNKLLSSSDVLTLRRHEKDYIIRKEEIYITKLNLLGTRLGSQLNKLPISETDSTKFFLENYLYCFNRIVQLDKQLGTYNNTGLKLQLSLVQASLEEELTSIVQRVQQGKDQLLKQLNYMYAGLVVGVILISFFVSFFIAKLITKPLTELTVYITRFVESHFTFEEDNPVIRSKDEVGRLTQNFTVLKQEIIAQLKFFKQKVDERTAELAQANRKLVSMNEANSRFVPNEFLQFLKRKSIEEVTLGDHIEQAMTVMFTDIREFTQISERLSPQENFDFINAYLNEIAPHVKEHGGFIDKFIGDSVMALFPDHADKALQAGIDIAQSVEEFNQRILKKSSEPIKIGVGLHYGQLILGTIGFEHRMETTVISDAVNIASRLEGLTKHYGTSIIVSHDFLVELRQKDAFVFRFLGNVKVRGKSSTIGIYEVVLPWEVKKRQSINRFTDALADIEAKRFTSAYATLASLREEDKTDTVVYVFLRRCEYFMENGVPEDWDGTQIMNVK